MEFAAPVGLICSDNGEGVALQTITVNVVIGHMISHVESVLLYKNTRPNAIETEFKFPLDEGSAIYKMEAEIDGKVIVAECQEKEQAQQTYDTAKATGMTTFLLKEDENSGDIFRCYLGNLPSQKEARLTVAYVTELSRETNRSVKFTLPTLLNPRYDSKISLQNTPFGQPFLSLHQPNQLTESGKGDYSFFLNIDIQSQFRIGSLTSETPELSVNIEEPDKTRAKASFSSEKCQISTDLSLFIQYEGDDQPTAIIERGSRGQDGMMKSDMLLLNFYPELQENCSKCGEFVFVIDRSGSMGGDNILNATQTLMLLVKTLRVGCYFNVVSFGSHFSKLFQKSVMYNRENMTRAVNLINTMTADMGGTELYYPLNSIFAEPLVPGHPRQLFVITDGAVSNVNQTVELVKKNSKRARVFSVGIGQGASTALVKGLARAGNGRCEFVYGEDRLQQKVMSLMKFSLQPEVRDLSFDWTLSQGVSADVVPQHLPNIFVGEMVTLYAIISGAERQEIVGGTVKMTGLIGEEPFEYLLEFEGQGHTDDTTVAAPIHRLAAKALVKDLEIEEMTEDGKNKKSEIVLVSVSANIVSKYTSFVGVDRDSKVPLPQPPVQQTSNFTFGSAPGMGGFGGGNPFGGFLQQPGAASFGAAFGGSQSPSGFGFCQAMSMPPSRAAFGSSSQGFGSSAGMGRGSQQQQQSTGTSSLFGSVPQQQSTGSSSLFGGFPQPQSTGSSSLFGSFPQPQSTGSSSLFGSVPQQQYTGSSSSFGFSQQQNGASFGGQQHVGAGFGGQQPGWESFGGQQSNLMFGSPTPSGGHSMQKSALLQDDVIAVISLQDVDGSWEFSEQLKELLLIPQSTQLTQGIAGKHWMTCLVIVWLELKHSNRKQEWELLSKKASDWLTTEIGAEALVNLKTLAMNEIKKL